MFAYSENSRESDVDLWRLNKSVRAIFTFLQQSVISGPSWSCYAFIDLKNSSEQRGALDQCEVWHQWHGPRVDLGIFFPSELNIIFPAFTENKSKKLSI